MMLSWKRFVPLIKPEDTKDPDFVDAFAFGMNVPDFGETPLDTESAIRATGGSSTGGVIERAIWDAAERRNFFLRQAGNITPANKVYVTKMIKDWQAADLSIGQVSKQKSRAWFNEMS